MGRWHRTSLPRLQLQAGKKHPLPATPFASPKTLLPSSSRDPPETGPRPSLRTLPTSRPTLMVTTSSSRSSPAPTSKSLQLERFCLPASAVTSTTWCALLSRTVDQVLTTILLLVLSPSST